MESADNFFKTLRKFLRNKVNSGELYFDSVENIRTDRLNRGNSEITIFFDGKRSDKFLEALGLTEDDIWFIKSITSPYSDYEFTDSYSARQDFKEGYFLYNYLNDDNEKRINDLCELLIGQPYDNDENVRSNLHNKLYELFPRETEDLIYDLTYSENNAKKECCEKEIEKQFKDLGNQLNANIESNYESITIEASELYNMYLRTGLLYETPDMLIIHFIKNFTNIELSIGYEMGYECDITDFLDQSSIDSDIDRWLDIIFDKLEELNEDSDVPFQDIIKMFEKIKSKFPVGKWFKLPKDNTVQFKLIGVDFNDGQLIIELKTENGKFLTRTISEENFYYLLYQPSLFNFEDLI